MRWGKLGKDLGMMSRAVGCRRQVRPRSVDGRLDRNQSCRRYTVASATLGWTGFAEDQRPCGSGDWWIARPPAKMASIATSLAGCLASGVKCFAHCTGQFIDLWIDLLVHIARQGSKRAPRELVVDVELHRCHCTCPQEHGSSSSTTTTAATCRCTCSASRTCW